LSDEAGVRELLEYTNNRITALQANFQTLNDCHHELEIKYTRMETRLDTVVQLVKWLITPGTGILILVELLKAVGII